MLATPIEPDSSKAANLVLTLGIIGAPEAVPALVEFLEGTGGVRDGTIPYQIYVAKANVPVALGCILNKIDLDLGASRDEMSKVSLEAKRKQVLDYLVSGLVNSQFWAAHIQWRSSFDPTPAARDLYLVKKAIQGLGISGDPTAACILDWTVRHLTDTKGFHEPPACEGISIETDMAHWGRTTPPIGTEDRDQISNLARAALKTNQEVYSYPTGLFEYYDRAVASNRLRKN
jgi:hypothetical protein